MIRFKTLVDKVNLYPFDCLIGISYFNVIPEEVPEVVHERMVMGTAYGIVNDVTITNLPTFSYTNYRPINVDQREKAKLTLPDLVDVYVKEVYCEIINDLDVVHLLHLCDDYMVYAENAVRNKHKEAVEFVKNLSNFRRDFLYPTFVRVVNKYPLLLKEYRVYNTGLNNMWLNLLGKGNSDYKDGIVKLKHPPYNIEDIINPPKQRETVTGIDGLQVDKPKEDDYIYDIFKAYSN